MSGFEGQLCVGCGLCCDGTLFAYADVFDKTPVIETIDVLLTRKGDKTKRQLPLPCSLLAEGASCGVYEDRPPICKSYRCNLLKAVANGERPLEDARAITHRTSELRDTVRQAIEEVVGPSPTLSIAAMIAALDAHRDAQLDPAAFTKEHAELYLSIAALGMAIESSFRSHQGSMWVSERVGED